MLLLACRSLSNKLWGGRARASGALAHPCVRGTGSIGAAAAAACGRRRRAPVLAGLAGAGTARVEAMAMWPSGALGQSALVSVLDGMRTGTPQQMTYGYTSVKTPHYDSYLREQADRSKSRSEALKTAFSAPA